MASPFQMLPLILKQNLGRQELERTPEPDSITAADDNVLQYDRVMETKLAISYAIAIETIFRVRPEPFGGDALDICCGPGHLSINMAKELKLDRLVGVDLSKGMVDVANKNARDQGYDTAAFQCGDATKLSDFADDQFDLTTMMDAAHHMPTLDCVTQVLHEMDRVTRPDGVVVLMDLVRLRTAAITEDYIEMLAHDYEQRGLPSFKEDFRNSMYAAWTPRELASSVPQGTQRCWKLIVPRGLPFAQFLVGVKPELEPPPRDATRLWRSDQIPVTVGDRGDFRIARMTMSAAKVTVCG